MDKKMICYKEDLGLIKPPVEIMYGAYCFLNDLGTNLQAKKVRVYASTLLNVESRFFSHMSQLEKQSKNGTTRYFIRNQREIDQLVAEKSRQRTKTREIGEVVVADPLVDWLDKSDKGGSYIDLEDEVGLIDGRITYVSDQSPRQMVHGCAEVLIGNGLGLGLVGFGNVFDMPLFTFGGLAISMYSSVRGLMRVFSGQNQLYINIKPKNNSSEAQEKIEDLIEKLMD